MPLSVESIGHCPVLSLLKMKSPSLAYTNLTPACARMRLAEETATGINQQLPSTPSLLSAEDFLCKTSQFRILEFGNKPAGVPAVTISFDTTPQPLFHKNFDLVSKSLTEYLVKGYRLYILTDNPKQGERLKDIFIERGENISFVTIGKTLHEGYADGLLKCCLFTDHQIFDRYHKYNLRSERARNGKVALTLKELQEFRIGDYVVHMDHGVGRFGGLVCTWDNRR